MKFCLFHRKSLFVVAALLVFAGASAFAQDTESQALQLKRLSLTEALKVAYEQNPDLRAARAQLKAVQELLPQAQAGWKPSISSELGVVRTDLDGDGVTSSTDGSTAKSVALSVTQSLYKGGSTFARNKAARYTIMAQELYLNSIEQSVLLQAATAYMDVLKNKAVLDLSIANRDTLQTQFEATQDRFDVGELTITDVSQAKARLEGAEANIIASRGLLNTSYAVFEEITGLSPVSLQEPTTLKLPLPQSLDEAIRLGEQNNPQVLSAVYAHKAAEEDIDDVFGELLPQISLSGSWGKTYDPSPGLYDDQEATSIGVVASIPLYQSGAVRSRVRQAKQTANQKFMDIYAVKRESRRQVISAWSDWNAARAVIASRLVQVEAARVAYEGAREENIVGSRTVLDTLDANQELLDAQVQLVTSKRDEVVAQFSLLSAIGALEPQALGFQGFEREYEENLRDVSHKILNMDVDMLQEVE